MVRFVNCTLPGTVPHMTRSLDVGRVTMESARGPSRRYDDWRGGGGGGGGYGGGGGRSRRPTRSVSQPDNRQPPTGRGEELRRSVLNLHGI